MTALWPIGRERWLRRRRKARLRSRAAAGQGRLAAQSYQLPDPLPDRLPPGLITGADVVVVDVETTGWLADAASITEIGAIRLASDGPPEEFTALVNPGHPIPAAITELTGISDDMVRHAPPIGEVLPKFIEFASGCVIVAHNAPFDLGFLTTACTENDVLWPSCAVIDTAVLARLVLRPGEVTDHKLATLADYFGTSSGSAHRALADAKTAAGVLIGLLSVLGARSRGGRRARGARPIR